MKRKLKSKLLAGFMLLVSLLIVAGSISIFEFLNLGKTVSSLIDNNYKTIVASRSMLEALEREDSGILLLMLGQWERGRGILEEADSLFLDALELAKKNVTEKNEQAVVDSISDAYHFYRSKWQMPIVDTQKEGNITWYEHNIHQDFLETKRFVDDLMTLNQNNLYEEASTLKDKAHRAIMPGIVAIIGALLFSVLLNFYINVQFVNPLKRLIKAIKSHHPDDRLLETNIRSEDEIKELEREVNKMIIRYSRRD